jgi:hypothetical protein
MELKGSLPHLQVRATRPYLEPDQSRPCPHITLPEDPSKPFNAGIKFLRETLPPEIFLPRILISKGSLRDVCISCSALKG